MNYWSVPRTHLEVLVFAPQQHPYRAPHAVTSVPLGEDGLSEIWVHDVLDSPGVRVGIAVRRKLLPHNAPMGPAADASLSYHGTRSSHKVFCEFLRYEAWNNHKSMGVVLFLRTE